MFDIQDVKERKDGSLDVFFKTTKDFEMFKLLAKEHCKKTRYSKSVGSQYFSYILMQGLKSLEKATKKKK